MARNTVTFKEQNGLTKIEINFGEKGKYSAYVHGFIVSRELSKQELPEYLENSPILFEEPFDEGWSEVLILKPILFTYNYYDIRNVAQDLNAILNNKRYNLPTCFYTEHNFNDAFRVALKENGASETGDLGWIRL